MRLLMCSRRIRPFFEIEGFGFRSCERLAEHYHIDPADARRQRALVFDTLIQYCFRSGSTFLRMEQLQAQIMQRYGFAPDEALQTLIEKGVLVEEEGRLYDHRQHAAECVIAARLNHPEPPAAEPEDLDEAIKHVEETLNITYDESQKAAIRGFFNHSFMILNGGPGTGKTTVIHGILLLDQKLYPDDEVTLAAPTGRAAKRLSELSGREASTLHSLLKWDLETNTFLKDEKDPLSSDVVIVDEFRWSTHCYSPRCSKALRPQTKLLLIRIGINAGISGKVRRISSSGRFPLYCLDTICRQSQGSGIATLAAAMRNGSPRHLSRMCAS
ncbi:MAG: ATP-dependent RecD-like DNA helicase [Merdibacter sp.]